MSCDINFFDSTLPLPTSLEIRLPATKVNTVSDRLSGGEVNN